MQKHHPPDQVDLLCDEKVLASAFHATGMCAMAPANMQKWYQMGVYMLGVAVELGNETSAIDYWKFERLNPRRQIPPAVRTIVKKMAHERRDWRAMSLYVDDLLRSKSTPGTRAEAYGLAKDLFDRSTPGKTARDAKPQDTFVQPWKLLRDAADQYLWDHRSGPEHEEAQAKLDQAVRDGASKYTDPAACAELLLDPSVEKFSDEWTSLQLQTAMQGDANACFELGKFYLEKHGWYPCIGNRSRRPNHQIGFHWIELAAALSSENAQAIARCYLAMAFVLRENGFSVAGRKWLSTGITDIRQNAPDNAEATTWIRTMESFNKDWESEFNKGKASDFLGPSQMEATS